MKIGAREIGPGTPAYVIAELGVNHDGSLETALELVDAAAGAGADAIKLQCFEAKLLMSRASRLAAYQARAGETDPIEMLARLELPLPSMARVIDRARARGLHAIVTIFSLPLVPDAAALPWDAFKTASPDLIHRPLLERLARDGRPLIVSTGASTLDEVARAVAWIEGTRPRLALLQCVSSYPVPDEHASLGAIGALATLAPAAVGYSDHTTRLDTGAMAVALGARVLEKHLTLDRAAPGPDHAASLEPDAFAQYTALARAAALGHAPALEPALIGASTKGVLECELDVRRASRQSIVARGAIPAGGPIARDQVCFKRPGTGLEPFRLADVVGRRAARPIEADMPIVAEDLA